jgi:hypothetical protein
MLSAHFSLPELAVTEVRHLQVSNLHAAARFGMTLGVLCSLLEKVRTLCGDRPIVIHSGFRSPELNRYIGGSKSSQHCKGEAADFHVPGLRLVEVFDILRRQGDLFQFGQCILEDGDGDGTPTWIHLSLPRQGRDNREYLTYNGASYKAVYPLT